MVQALIPLPAILLAFGVTAGPVILRGNSISLSLSRHSNFTGTRNIIQSDLARIRSIRAHNVNTDAAQNDVAARAVVGVPVINELFSYTASIGVGEPATYYDLIVDTGSSNTWVGANKSYVPTSTAHPTGDRVGVRYGSGLFNLCRCQIVPESLDELQDCNEWTDKVSLAPDLVIENQSIGVASRSAGFQGVDGILGIGPVDLTERTLSPDSNLVISTVTDNLFSQGTITQNMIGVSFEPPTSTADSQTNGEITFGGTDESKYTGEITYTPITSTSPASKYWGIDQSISYGGATILSTTAGIVDTGTTLIYLATNAFNAYQAATGGVPDPTTGLLSITPEQLADLEDFNFDIAGTTFALTPNAQIWPRSLNSEIGGTADSIYLIVADIGSSSGSGLDFINGMTFLERFYSVYDTTNRQVGFATTAYTTATTN
ncbi:family A1 protease [Mycena pura]|uniref:Family A1 protease n=1 Tax=Mycena pura TaxID=153505 RepID=A0AAD6V3L5_9AGAR|nr:family A1 protease [Mycena pura]